MQLRPFFPSLVAGLLLVASNGTQAFSCEPRGCPISSSVNVRGAPTLDPAYANDSWTPPPPGWIFGTWSLAYSSSQSEFYNQRYDIYPRLPMDGSEPLTQWTEIIAFDTANTSFPTITINADADFLPDLPDYSLNFTVSSGGQFFFGFLYDIIAWGYDTNGDAFYVGTQLEGFGLRQDPPSMALTSRVLGGPSECTVEEVRSSIIALGDPVLSAQARNLTRTLYDDRLPELVPILCDTDCVNNTLLVAAAAALEPGN